MRILHIYKDYYPVLGGIENHVKLLAEEQAARGHQVSVLVTSLDRKARIESLGGVRVLYAARLATLSSAPLSTALVGLLRRERPDVAHLHFPYPWGEVANYFFGHAARTVITYHSDIVRQKFLRVFYAPLMKRVLARADAIIATSPNYIASSPILSRLKQKCVVVPLGIDPEPFEEAHFMGADGRAPVLLFVGRLRYYKGLNYLLEAMRDIAEAQLVIVGTGPMEREWKSRARDLGLLERVQFVGDVPPQELPGFYAACDVFVLPASERSEAFGAVQLEAMAAGKPVVSCDVGTGVAWVNQNQVTGLVVPPRDPVALTQAVKRLIEDEALRKKMGAAGRARVRAEFTVDRMVEGVLSAYQLPSSVG